MTKLYFYLILLIGLVSCSNFDEQEFTVLLPNAVEDEIVFTNETDISI